MQPDHEYNRIMTALAAEVSDERDAAEAAPAETTAPVAEKPAEPKTPEFAPEISERMTKAGVSPELAASLGDDLASYLDSIEPIGSESPAAESESGKKPEAKPQTDAEKAADPFAHLRGKYEDELIDGMAKALESHVAAAVAPLQQKLQAHDAQAQAAQIAREEAEFEAFFSKPGDEFAALLGKGNTEALAPNSPEKRLRFALAREVAIDRRVRQEIAKRFGMADRPISIAEAARRVLVAKFPNRIAQAERERIRKESTRRQASAIEPPTNHKGFSPDESGDAALLAEIRAIKERG